MATCTDKLTPALPLPTGVPRSATVDRWLLLLRGLASGEGLADWAEFGVAPPPPPPGTTKPCAMMELPNTTLPRACEDTMCDGVREEA